jgi:hypothetical protein
MPWDEPCFFIMIENDFTLTTDNQPCIPFFAPFVVHGSLTTKSAKHAKKITQITHHGHLTIEFSPKHNLVGRVGIVYKADRFCYEISMNNDAAWRKFVSEK